MSLQSDLHDLFLLDQTVRGLEGRMQSATARQKVQQSRLDQFRQQLDELNDQVRHAKAGATGLEHQARDTEERITSLRQRMNTATNNKEYSALLIEVNNLKTEKSKLEDQAIREMERVEELEAQAKELAAKVADQEKLVAAAKNEVARSQAEIGEQLDIRKAEREVAAAKIPPDIIPIFDRLADSYEGETMAEVHEESRRHLEYTCGGCYIGIPVERLNTLMSKPDLLVQCPSCGRILFVGQELRSSIAG